MFYDKPFLKFERLARDLPGLSRRAGFKSFSMAMPLWLREKLFLKDLLIKELEKLDGDRRLERAAVVQRASSQPRGQRFLPVAVRGGGRADHGRRRGVGDDLRGDREGQQPRGASRRSTSRIRLGLLYSAFTYYTGFKVNSGEYKVMGLAPYGEPKYADKILEHLIDVKADGSFRLDLSYFNYCTGLTMTNAKFDELFGGPPRKPDELLTQRHMDLAASIQAVTEEVVLRLTRSLRKETGIRNLCLAGGVALNCVANGKVLRDGQFEQIWIQPAAGDAGGALGAALAAYHMQLGPAARRVNGDAMQGLLSRTGIRPDGHRGAPEDCGARFDVLGRYGADRRLARKPWRKERRSAGSRGAWSSGRARWANRSILGDPRSPTHAEDAQPQGQVPRILPAVRAVGAARATSSDWFELDGDSPYMLLVADVVKSRAPRNDGRGEAAVRHRQAQRAALRHPGRHPRRLLGPRPDRAPRHQPALSRAADRPSRRKTGCPVLVNTSFNVRGEPIVCTPEDAFRCFMGTEMDVLAVGNCYLRKEDQDPALKQNYETAFELD